ncbi:hypothetical protein AAXB25_29140 [Paenibacillus lautus]|uniref:hypothetical protein n=1 Tax=Paenibacillus lautus TaxID=1401 RepID=UPI003D29B74F
MISQTFFNSYIRDINDLDAFSQVADFGTDYLYNIRIAEDADSSEPNNYEIERTREIKNFASIQEKEGFPYLYNLVSVRAWSILEAFVDDFFILYLSENFENLNNDTFTKIKGSLIDFVFMPRSEQVEYLFDLIKLEYKINTKLGINRFEGLLKLIKHDGEVNDIVARHIYELSQIRNVIVHRNGRADNRLIDNCPWLNLSNGQQIKLDGLMFTRYLKSIYWYVLELFDRHFNKTDRSEFKDYLHHLKNEQIKSIKELGKLKDLRKIREN